MYICFAEYRIKPECREAYLKAATMLMERASDMRLYEGTDQPHLFVEVWEAATAEGAEAIKKERRDERSAWGELNAWIDGGQAKLHVWTFKAASLSS
ncbi:hypothetical protein [Paenibacillus sp. HB172176]|uniref:hypothetical protein n=1 Tax=Paenibacillus sp. HB172176 TaxID=2493690 RepID=UPI001438D297|nr:hypothetical protein [Paenibacillus sp. HB172176]